MTILKSIRPNHLWLQPKQEISGAFLYSGASRIGVYVFTQVFVTVYQSVSLQTKHAVVIAGCVRWQVYAAPVLFYLRYNVVVKNILFSLFHTNKF